MRGHEKLPFAHRQDPGRTGKIPDFFGDLMAPAAAQPVTGKPLENVLQAGSGSAGTVPPPHRLWSVDSKEDLPAALLEPVQRTGIKRIELRCVATCPPAMGQASGGIALRNELVEFIRTKQATFSDRSRGLPTKRTPGTRQFSSGLGTSSARQVLAPTAPITQYFFTADCLFLFCLIACARPRGIIRHRPGIMPITIQASWRVFRRCRREIPAWIRKHWSPTVTIARASSAFVLHK